MRRSGVRVFIQQLLGLSLSLCVIAGCGEIAKQNPALAVPTATTPLPASPTMYAGPTATLVLPPELERQREIGEATRFAILTTVPQVTLGPDWTPSPEIFATPFPIPSSVRHAAGAGMILEDGQAVGAVQIGDFKNQWSEQVGNETIIVYAGVSRTDEAQGLLVIVVHAPGQEHPQLGSYPTLYRVGWIKVIDAIGERLVLQARDSSFFYFDVPTRQWVSATGTPIPLPSASPQPTATP